MLSVAIHLLFAECHYADCRYAECRSVHLVGLAFRVFYTVSSGLYPCSI
jgi:hypothetical protein